MFAPGTSGMAACSASAMSALVSTSTRDGGTAGESRATVSAMSGRSPTRASSGFGRSGVLSGQKRDPIPPANTSAQSERSVRSSASASGCSAGSVPTASGASALAVPPNAASSASPNESPKGEPGSPGPMSDGPPAPAGPGRAASRPAWERNASVSWY
jgi:hypothetical protein